MARPLSRGVDYFPLDVDIDQDDKIALIEADHGLIGFAIVIKLFMKIYSEGYYYQWSEIEQKLFQRRVNVDADTLLPIVNDCIKYGLFDENAYRKHNILTSRGIQERYFKIVSRRKDVRVHEQYLVLDEDEIKEYKNLIINSHCQSDELMPAITSNEEGLMSTLTTDDGELMVEETRQRKVKESRVNQSKEKGDYTTDANASKTLNDDRFEEFWGVYNKKVSKTTAKKAWDKLKMTDSLFEEIMIAIRNQLKYDQWESKKYQPHASTWLNQKRWEDEIIPSKEQSKNQGNTWGASAMNQYRREQKQKGEKNESVTEPYDVQLARILAEEEKQRQRVAESQRRLREREKSAGA